MEPAPGGPPRPLARRRLECHPQVSRCRPRRYRAGGQRRRLRQGFPQARAHAGDPDRQPRPGFAGPRTSARRGRQGRLTVEVSREEAVRKLALAVVCLLLLAAAADALVVVRLRIDPWQVGSVLAAFSLLLGSFVALANDDWVRELRRLAERSREVALAPSFS